MIPKKLEDAINKQIEAEGYSSRIYLSMACWAEQHGLEGTADFMYAHSEEERMHMLKFIKFLNERDGKTIVGDLQAPPSDFVSLKDMFEQLYEHEQYITNCINELVHLSLEEKDYSTHNFLQWFVSEQLEEEALAKTILDKLKLIGDEPGGGLYLFDRDIATLTATSSAGPDA